MKTMSPDERVIDFTDGDSTQEMNDTTPEENDLRLAFEEALYETLDGRLGLTQPEPLVAYLSEMLVRFAHHDDLYSVYDAYGRRLTSVTDMVAEGDVRLNATSFERERAVHRHIGDFLLFWSGVFPDFLRHLKSPAGKDALLDPIRQGQISYYVVSTFDYGRFADEAPTYRRLSEEFEVCRLGLSLMRDQFEGFLA